jgi:hypothetical protein
MTSTTRLTIRLNVPRELFDQEKTHESPDYRLEEPTDLPPIGSRAERASPIR